MSGTQGLIVVGAHTRLGYVHYLRGHYQEAIREYRRELSFLTLSDHALRDRTIIEVSQKLAAAYTRLGAEDEARTYGDGADRGFDRRLAAGADDPFTRYYLAALHALRDDVEPLLSISSGRCASWAPSRAGGCRAIRTSPGCCANPAVAAALRSGAAGWAPVGVTPALGRRDRLSVGGCRASRASAGPAPPSSRPPSRWGRLLREQVGGRYAFDPEAIDVVGSRAAAPAQPDRQPARRGDLRALLQPAPPRPVQPTSSRRPRA